MKIFNLSKLAILFIIFNSPAVSAEECNENQIKLCAKEKEDISKFVTRIVRDSPEQAIGQLFMVNINENYMNAFHRSNRKKLSLIEAHGVGSVILQNNNFQYMGEYTSLEEERIDLVSGFVKNLRYRALASQENAQLRNIPLFVASDFENSGGSDFGEDTGGFSIKEALIPPPAALTLAMTRDSEIIFGTGRIVGSQLANSGINMILGPVLDLDVRTGSDEEDRKNTLMSNRSFSSDADSISNIAAYYIKGLRESGIAVIGKHFPGIGSVNGDPHKEPVSFNGNMDKLADHLSPFIKLNELLDGVMTSHVSIKELDGKVPATFSRTITSMIKSNKSQWLRDTNLSGIGLDSEKLIITDDLGMKAVSLYNKKKLGHKAYIDRLKNLTIKAFDAGHDLILFSRIKEGVSKTESNAKKGLIDREDFIVIKNALLSHVKRSGNKERFKDALTSVITSKAKIYKMQGGNVQDFFGHNEIGKITSSKIMPYEAIRDENYFINSELIRKKYEKTFMKTYSILTEKKPISVGGESSKYCLMASVTRSKESYSFFNKYPAFDKAHGKLGPTAYKAELNSFLRKTGCQKILFDISKDSNSLINKLINTVQVLNKTNANEHLIILMHANPVLLTSSILKYKNLTVMGTFDNHAYSYYLDKKAVTDPFFDFSDKKITIKFKGDEPDSVIFKMQPHEIQIDKPTFLGGNGITKKNMDILDEKAIKIKLASEEFEAKKNKVVRDLQAALNQSTSELTVKSEAIEKIAFQIEKLKILCQDEGWGSDACRHLDKIVLE